MKKLALQVEHKCKNRVVGVHLIEGGHGKTTTLGSARSADIRLLGEDVAGIHAAFDLQGENWILCDLGSKAGTWVDQKPVIERKIEGATVIHIGSHQLKATPRVFERPLFTKDLETGNGEKTFHQVAILRNNVLKKSLLLKQSESYISDMEGVGTLAAPQGSEWIVTEKDGWTIKQRLAKASEIKETLSDSLGNDWKRPAPVLGALLLVCLLVGLALLMPQRPDGDMKTLTPDNQYTRMIFDGKKTRQKKMIAEKLRKTIQGQAQSSDNKNPQPAESGAKAAGVAKAVPGAKVVMNLKNAGLGALIGRVAARAAKTANLVQSAGVAPDSQAAGRALGLGGGSALDKLGGGGGGTPGGQAMHVGGLGTSGKGGGSSAYKGSGSLSVGNIGNGEVGVLEEETEVDGGLDKEAIARVIRSQLGQIRYCYERQLSANPDLYGKILVKFTIGATGNVVTQTIGTTSLNNAMVEGCILRRVAGWQFPQPKGGTNVLVTYPFLFKSTR